jgi:hypothetical protein
MPIIEFNQENEADVTTVSLAEEAYSDQEVYLNNDDVPISSVIGVTVVDSHQPSTSATRSNIMVELNSRHPDSWTAQDVGIWLESLQVPFEIIQSFKGMYAPIFSLFFFVLTISVASVPDFGVDGRKLASLTSVQLKRELGIFKYSDRYKIESSLNTLRVKWNIF